MKRKPNNMSLAADPEFHERLKRFAAKRSVSVSQLIRDMADKYLGMDVESSFDTVILKIPVEMKKNPEDLKRWVYQRAEGIVKALTR